MRRTLLGLALSATLPLAAVAREDVTKPAPAPPRAWKTAVAEPKPLGDPVKKGLDWLVKHQHEDGGWAQGEESEAMRGGGQQFGDRSNVADTCIAALALIRSGSTPAEGPYKDAIARGVRFVRGKVEKSDAGSLSVTDVNGTRVQMKLGPNIDTFLASMLLSEVKGRMPEADEKGVDLALTKVITKIEAHQKADGSFEGGGWAPVLAQAMSGKGINRARQAGARVSDKALAQAENGAKAAFYNSVTVAAAPVATPATAAGADVSGPVLASKPTSGPVEVATAAEPAASASRPVSRAARLKAGTYAYSAGRGVAGGAGGFGGGDAAGVELYARSANLGLLSDSVNTNKAKKDSLKKLAESAEASAQKRDEAKVELGRIEESEKVQKDAQQAIVARLDDKQFIAGFGSNGGEEFLSYMTIGESLVVKGGHDWETWDRSITDNLNRIQNGDGSWSGHHCITGRTFCTSTALLVLLTDRTPVPVQAADEAKTAPKPVK